MKRSLFVVLTLITITFYPIAASVRAAKLQNSLSAQQASSQARTQAHLAKDVRHELLMLPYYTVFDWLQFEIKPDGKVVLMGEVTRPTLKSDAGNVVKKIEGVEEVVNQIEVLPLSPNDDRIRRAVYRVLFNYNSQLYRYSMGAVPSIHIIVKNGHVTLKGKVTSKMDADYANLKVNGVSGVFSVKNELEIEKS